MDKLSKEESIKETIDINEVVTRLSRLDDAKVTYTNGFHVNLAYTKTDRINLDSLEHD